MTHMSIQKRALVMFLALVAAALLGGCVRAPIGLTPVAAPAPIPAPADAPFPAEPAFPESVVPAQEPPAPPAPTPFSVVWLADTQSMSYYDYPGALSKMGRWIVDQKDRLNILYVVQTGDAVDEGWVPKQWRQFDQLYNEFAPVLPYFPIAGNHDVGMQWHGYGPYLARSYVRSIPRFNSFEGGRAAFATFSAGGTDFLLLGAGWESELDASGWMNDVLRRYPDRVAILLFHGYINVDGSFTKVGSKMFEQVVQPNPNVRIVLSGHVRGTGFRADDLDDTGDGLPDRRVNAMIYNYQHYGENCGQLRILTFDPQKRDISVTTYSPYKDRFYPDDYFKAVTFDLENAF